MVIRRGGRLPPSPILMSSAAGRSFSKSYAMPTRSVGAFYPGRSRASSVLHDSRADDYYLFDRVSDVSYLSNATLDTSDDTVRRSRGRDQKLLRDATSAIPSRGSVRDTSALTSSATPFGPRRFPRRVGKPTLRKNQSSSFYATSLAPNSNEAAPTKGLSTSDAMASASPAPSSGSWRRYGGSLPRSASEARSFYQDVEASLDKAPRKPRAMSVDPYLSSPSYTPTMGSPVLSRRSMPPPPLSTLSESRLLNTGRVGSTTYTRPTYSSAPVHPGYEPVYVEFEPENKPVYPTRRRPRVLASARRPAGNYYQRLLRKRGKQQGRFGPYYDLESIEGSDLSVLSDTGSLDGTYEVGYDDIDCTGVSPPSSPPTYRRILDLPSSSSPYYVDQDTEFVPFGPSRPLQTKGLFELSPYDADDDDVDVECYNSRALPSPTTDLSLSTYLPSYLTPPSLKAPTATAPSVSLPPLPYRSVVPYTSSLAASSPAVPSSHIPSQQLFESLIASSIQRAKSALNTLAIPAYQGASLVLSVEGAGLSPEGKRVGFTYTPPPIPLYGRSPRLDDNLLAIKPLATVKPVDSFLAGYMDRMQALRLALNTGLDRDRSRRLEYGLAPLETGPRLSTTSTHTPSYTQSHEYVPVKHLTSQKLDRLPVTTYRSRYDDGRTHRVDVFSLGEIQPRLPDSSQAIKIPESATGGYELSVLDKINIKAAIIASKMEPDPMKRRRPRSEYAAKKYRQLRMDSKDSIYSGLPSSGGLRSSVPSAPRPSDRKIIRTEDGYSKPKNLLSWQYRLDSMINPKDVLYEPASFGRIRSQVRNAQERMDRHRQMIDRYLPEEGEDSTSAKDRVLRKMADMEKHDPVIGGGVDTRRPTVTIPNYYACGGDPSNPPMSDLRRRIRRTLNKTRHSSVF
ncbi:uncharacterized protein [Littorina saxatilis]|uniref:uncharacterized protein isoform X3 n=1 Tax=Littorina saxatilis TaxID=31220 RepID=UPI0038B5F9C3